MKKQPRNRSDNSELQKMLNDGILLNWSDNTNLNQVQFGRDGTIKVDLGNQSQELGTSNWLQWSKSLFDLVSEMNIWN